MAVGSRAHLVTFHVEQVHSLSLVFLELDVSYIVGITIHLMFLHDSNQVLHFWQRYREVLGPELCHRSCIWHAAFSREEEEELSVLLIHSCRRVWTHNNMITYAF